MGERHAIASTRQREPREVMLAAMSIEHGTTIKQIADALSLQTSTVGQMLRALAMDGCVRRSAMKWYRTDEPLPAVPSSTAVIGGEGRERFDFSALMIAWSPHSANERRGS